MTFNEQKFYYLSNPKEVGSKYEVYKEAIRMEIPMPFDHDEEEDATPNFEQPEENIR